MVIAAVGVLLSLVLSWQRRSPGLMVWLSGVLCSFALGGCGGVPDPPDVPIPQDRLRKLCWQPPETPTSDYFYFPDTSGEASAVENRFQLEKALADHGFLFTYNAQAPALNLRLLPMSRSEAWCTSIPKPTDENVLQLLSPCIAPAFGQRERVTTRNLLGQTEPSVRSTLFCGQMPQMAPTPQSYISLLARNIANLPRFLKSPNASGAIVHKILGSNKLYYQKVEEYRGKATSAADMLQRLRRIGENLKNGTFFHAIP